MFVATHKEPFVFLRERSRIAARATGDFVNELMKPVVRQYFKDTVDGMFAFKIRQAKDVKLMIEINKKILSVVFSD